MHVMRVIPLHITLPHLRVFDARLRSVVTTRLHLSDSLDHTALYSFSQPMSKAGLGLLPLETIAAAARWSAIAISAPDTQFLVDDGGDFPLIRDRVLTFRTLVDAGVPVTALAHHDCDLSSDEWRTLPANPSFVLSHYRAADGSSLRHIQHRVTCDILGPRRTAALRAADDLTFTRTSSCELKSASLWLSHVDEAVQMSDSEFELAIRLRCGLPPSSSPLPSVCPLCRAAMADDAYHFFSCPKLKRRSVNRRHDSLQNGIARFARANQCLVSITPKQADSKVPDLRIVFADGAVQVDVSGTHPLAPSIEPRVRGAPGAAAAARERSKEQKYGAEAKRVGDGFLPFVLESFGGFGQSALVLLQRIEDEGACVDASPHRMSMRRFMAWAAVDWQRHNSRIFAEWRRLILDRAGS